MSTPDKRLVIMDDQTGEMQPVPLLADILPALQNMPSDELAHHLDQLRGVAASLRAASSVVQSELAKRMQAKGAKVLPAGEFEAKLEEQIDRVFLAGLAELPRVLTDAGLEMPVTKDGKPAMWTETKGDYRLLKGLRKYGGDVARIIDENVIETPKEPRISLKRM